ncbi:acetyltransferase, GNAT family [Bifidobacterium dolichotidis]|uniref:Acetyltransferase, GNAT family n=1 Tax=Bifidobacterium dolichotidis TaxID=2306976 RepID=A0A430FRT1_9BIFI|nr:GNAT family N-acetyltransferase [Bifidobacterium dolichotidis]RSX55574.1 acetyltransferase, GNAT family [Bifidobacterium dolichotidis]
MNSHHAQLKNVERLRPEIVDYRQVQWDDFEDILTAFDRVWPIEIPGIAGTPTAVLVSRFLTLHFMSLTTNGFVGRTSNGEFAGVLLMRVQGKPYMFPEAAEALEMAKGLMKATPNGRRMLDFQERFLAVEKELEDDSLVNQDTQGEIELFMVNTTTQGMGVGGALWRRAQEEFAAEGVTSFFLHTDSTCDYEFYDHKGMQRVAERIHADHPEDTDVELAPVGTGPISLDDDQYIYMGKVQAE